MEKYYISIGLSLYDGLLSYEDYFSQMFYKTSDKNIYKIYSIDDFYFSFVFGGPFLASKNLIMVSVLSNTNKI